MFCQWPVAIDQLVPAVGGQSGAPVSRNQAPVWIHQSPLQGLKEEHRPAHHAVCVVEPVDDAHEVDGSGGMKSGQRP